MTAYTTASDSVESLHAPYLITPPTQAGLPKEPSTRSRTVKAEEVLLSRPVFDTRHGCSFFRHPSLPSDYKDVLFLELSTRGGVVARRLRMGTESEIQVIDPFIATPSILNDWTPDVKQLAEVGEAAEEVTEAARWDGRLERMAGVYKRASVCSTRTDPARTDHRRQHSQRRPHLRVCQARTSKPSLSAISPLSITCESLTTGTAPCLLGKSLAWLRSQGSGRRPLG